MTHILGTRSTAIIFVLCVSACGPDNPLDECSESELGTCDAVQTCCDSTECHFIVDGRDFPCDEGKECDAAEAEVREYCSAPEQT